MSGASPRRCCCIAALLLLIPVSEFAIAVVQKLVEPPRRGRERAAAARAARAACPTTRKTIVVIPTLLTSVEGVAHAARSPRGGRDRQSRSAHSLRDPQRLCRRRRRARAPATSELLEVARAGHRRPQCARSAAIRGPQFLPASTAIVCGTSASRCGWDGSASAASSRSSTACCAAPPTPASRPAGRARTTRWPASATCITLDSDTQLPRDTARELIGIISHPLNRPVVDPQLRRVTDGYGILQPRVSVTMASAAGSLFARTYAGHTGVDPYTTAVSDVYQDLFGEGIFTGKGLYDVDAFMTVARGPRAGERAAVARPVRRRARARRARHRRRSRRRLPVERADAREAAASLGARRLADPVVAVPVGADPRRASSATACRSSRAGRSSTTCAAAWCRRRWWRCSSPAGRSCPAGRSSGRWSRSRRCRSAVIARARQLARRTAQGLRACRVFLRASTARISAPTSRASAIQLTFVAHQAWDMLDAVGVTLARLVTAPAAASCSGKPPPPSPQRTRRLDVRGFYDGDALEPDHRGDRALLIVIDRRGRSALPVGAADPGACGLPRRTSRSCSASRRRRRGPS